jgi:hypothetical protein
VTRPPVRLRHVPRIALGAVVLAGRLAIVVVAGCAVWVLVWTVERGRS